jgi:hypothetical protein
MAWISLFQSFKSTRSGLDKIGEALRDARAELMLLANNHSQNPPPIACMELTRRKQSLRAWWDELNGLLQCAKHQDCDLQVVYEQVAAAHSRFEGLIMSQDDTSASEDLALRRRVVEQLQSTVHALQQREDAPRLLENHCVNVRAFRTTFMQHRVSIKEEPLDQHSFEFMAQAWETEGTRVLATCIAQGRSPTAEETQMLIDHYQNVISGLEYFLKALTHVVNSMNIPP